MPRTRFATVPLLLVLLAACDFAGLKSYRLVFQLIEANGSVPADPRIADVVEELRNTLQFEGYSLKNELEIALKPTEKFSHEIQTTDGPHVVYMLKGGLDAAIQIGGRDEVQALRFRIDKGSETLLETTVGIKPDQVLVLGSVPHTDEATLLIVVRMIET